jgi:hypothetical protein
VPWRPVEGWHIRSCGETSVIEFGQHGCRCLDSGTTTNAFDAPLDVTVAMHWRGDQAVDMVTIPTTLADGVPV